MNSTTVFRDYGQEALDAQYNNRARVPEHQDIHAGYQVLDHNGRVLRREPPAPPEEQARRRQAMEAEQQAQRQAERDKELERLYAGPEDAVRARERQIEALELRISYATNTLAQLEEKRDQEVSLAARAERAGRPVPEGTRQAIEEYQRRMAHVRQEIAGYEKDKQAVREQYAPIIERLEELAGS
jgi:chromosome segregation ATPase